MKWSTLLITCLLVPLQAASDTWTGKASKISGVALISLGAGASGFYVGLLDGESKVFLRHCTQGGKVFVSGLSAPVKCQLGNPEIRGEFVQILLATNRPLPLSVPLVISKKPIPPRLNLPNLSVEELEMLKTADHQSLLPHDKEASVCYQSRYKEMGESSAEIDRRVGKDVTGPQTTYRQDHERYVREIKSSAQYKKFAGKKFKIPTPNGFLYTSAIGLDSCELMDWNIVNTVYVKVNDSLVETTSFDGCINGGFKDLNGDGVPEVLTETCFNGEAMYNSYWTLFPKAKVLLQD